GRQREQQQRDGGKSRDDHDESDEFSKTDASRITRGPLRAGGQSRCRRAIWALVGRKCRSVTTHLRLCVEFIRAPIAPGAGCHEPVVAESTITFIQWGKPY